MRKQLMILLLLLPLAAAGQTKKSMPLFEQAVEKGVAGKNEEAVKLLLKALDSDPGYAEAWLVLGNQYMVQEKYAEAVDSYERCLDLDLSSPR
ncbi:MAG: tetratricopeptide repeat protein, partial [Bacteroidales bacterium]|nr:tetratricopeptide repeat protein [Bacteroidales bacterium]